MSASNNDPTPGSEPEFNLNSEKYYKSLDNLIAFKVRTENFNGNQYRIGMMWSINIGEAAHFAHTEFECDGWYVISVERVFDDEFFKNIDPTEGLEVEAEPDEDEDDEDEVEEDEDEDDTEAVFFEIMRNIDWE